MTNKKFLLGILLLVFGITTAWADARLNGIWVNYRGTVRRMINGNFGEQTPREQGLLGTYTISGGRITFTTTHVHGEILRTSHAGRNAELRFHTLAEAQRILGAAMWQPATVDFSISGNILTITNAQGVTTSWLRKY